MKVENLADLQKALDFSRNQSEFSIWISLGDSQYPYINVLIKGDLAYVHYFEKEGHPGYQSIGRSTEDGMITINEEDQMIVPMDTLVSVDKAAKAGQEFLKTHILPNAIEWLEL